MNSPTRQNATQKIEAINAELAKTIEEVREDLQNAVAKNPVFFGAAVVELKIQDGVVTHAKATLEKHRRPK